MALFDDLKVHDKGVADAFQKVVKANKAGKIDPAGIDVIIDAVKVASSDFAKRELIFLLWYDADFTAEGLAKWEATIGTAYLGKEGGAKLLRTSADRSEITKALDLAAANVAFVSPKLGVEYNACQYRAIKQLVDDRKIRVIEALKKSPSGTGAAAAYVPELNLLKLYSISNHTAAIAHELTHAVQDWNDVSGFEQFVEADAWVATLIVNQVVNGPLRSDSPLFAAADMIAKGGAKVTNPAWVGTAKKPGEYDKLVTFLASGLKTPLDRVDMINTESGTSEKDVLANIMKKLCPPTSAAPKPPAKAAPAPAPVRR